MEKNTIVVSAGIIHKQGKILISKRKKDASFEADKWEFPGGKIEFSEDPKSALIREIKEELDITITVDNIFGVVSHTYDIKDKKTQVILLFYFADHVFGKTKNLGCQEFKWINKEDLNDYDFANADKIIVKKLLN